MFKKFILIFSILIISGNFALANRLDREFLVEDLDEYILLYIETTDQATDMYVKVGDIDYIGTKEYKDKNYFQFNIPKEVYNNFENENQFIENLYINESGKEINILRTARENIAKEKDSLNSINNQLITDESQNIENNAPEQKAIIEDDRELDKYYKDKEGVNLKLNPFFILGLVITILGIIINMRDRK